MLSLNSKISTRQLQILLILDVFGTGVMVLPRRVSEFAGQDGWILIILATVIAAVYMYVITSLGEMFPKDTFVSYTSKIVSKPIGVLISVFFVIKILVSSALELRIFTEIVKQVMLFHTPSWVISFGMLAIGGFAAAKGYETRARIAEILVFVIFVPLVIVFCIAATDVDFSNLKPFFVANPSNVVVGGFFTAFAFSGIEFCLLAFPYLQRPNSVKKATTHAVMVIGVLMLLITIITIARFGPVDIAHQIWPVLEMMDTINLPGSFIERQDALILSFWIVSIFAIINACLFFASMLMKDIVKKGDSAIYIVLFIPIVYGISRIPESVTDTYTMINTVYMTFGFAYIFVIPLLLLIIGKLRRLG